MWLGVSATASTRRLQRGQKREACFCPMLALRRDRRKGSAAEIDREMTDNRKQKRATPALTALDVALERRRFGDRHRPATMVTRRHGHRHYQAGIRSPIHQPLASSSPPGDNSPSTRHPQAQWKKCLATEKGGRCRRLVLDNFL